jgi:hypothetical protein
MLLCSVARKGSSRCAHHFFPFPAVSHDIFWPIFWLEFFLHISRLFNALFMIVYNFGR